MTEELHCQDPPSNLQVGQCRAGRGSYAADLAAISISDPLSITSEHLKRTQGHNIYLTCCPEEISCPHIIILLTNSAEAGCLPGSQTERETWNLTQQHVFSPAQSTSLMVHSSNPVATFVDHKRILQSTPALSNYLNLGLHKHTRIQVPGHPVQGILAALSLQPNLKISSDPNLK